MVSGLTNVCYQNALLQALFATGSLRERLLDGAPSDERGWLASMRERLLDGAPFDAPLSKAPKLDAWLTEMRLSSVHDTKGTGVWDGGEFRAVFQRASIEMSAAEVRALIDAYDSNGDGKIDLKELTKLLNSTSRFNDSGRGIKRALVT